MKVWILQNQMRTEKQMRAAALRHRFFFFFFTLIYSFFFSSRDKFGFFEQ